MLEAFAVLIGAMAIALVVREPAAADPLCSRCATWKDPAGACPRCGAP